MYRDVSPTSRVRAEVRKKSGHSVWAKYREASEVIDLHELFNDYWTSNNHEFTVLSQSSSPTSPRLSNQTEKQRLLSLESIVDLYNYNSLQMMQFVCLPYLFPQLTMSAQAEALRSSLHELEELLKEYTPLMSSSTEKHVDRAIKYGAVFAEVSSPKFTEKIMRI